MTEISPHAEFRIEDGITAGIRDPVSSGQVEARGWRRRDGPKEGLEPVQYGPANDLGDGRDAEVATVVNIVAQANAVHKDVAGGRPRANRNPVRELSLEHQLVRQTLVVQQARLHTHVAGPQSRTRIAAIDV